MAKKTIKQDDTFQGSPAPDLNKADLGALQRLAAAGDEGGEDEDFRPNFDFNNNHDTAGDDWSPEKETQQQEIEPEEKKKKAPGRPKKEKPVVAPRQAKIIEIRSGELVNSIFCTYRYDHNLAPTIVNGIRVESQIPVHDDMRIAFKQLAPHLAVIFGAMELDDINKIVPGDKGDAIFINLNRFNIISFKLEDYAEEETVVLVGTEQLPTGIAKLITPPIRFVNSKYDHVVELRAAIDVVIFEIEEYLHGRKRADDPQLELGL